jgi:protein tyrosine/serine phosphatase
MIKRILPIAIILLLSIGFMPRKIESKKMSLPNFHKVHENLYRGGQPTEDGIEELAKQGVKTIINFRDTDGKVLREQKLAEENGMKFYNPHLSNWFKAKDSEIEKILEIIENPENQPVFIHCKRGADRTGTVVAVYRMKYEGWTAEQANQEAKEYGLGWWQFWMKDYINDYYKKLRENNE